MMERWLILMLMCFGMCSCASVADNRNGQPPNFVLILADDQAWNGTSVEMEPGMKESASDFHQTPFLEELASKGIRFSNARAAAPVCAPSRYSIQFGKSPARLRLIRVGMDASHIPHAEWQSIAKVLRSVDSTYVAAHFGKWGMGASPEILGFEVSDGATRNVDGGFVNDKSQWETTMTRDPKKILELTDRATSFLDSCAANSRPFYLQVSHYAVHSNIQTSDSSFAIMNSRPLGDRHRHVGFAGMTLDLDQSLGKILEKLEELGMSDDTYVIYMSDNGGVPNIPGAKKYEQSLNHPLQRGKWDAMEGGLRIPMVVAGPGILPGSHSNAHVWGADLLPTIADLANGLALLPDSLDGGSMKPVLQGKKEVEVTRSVNGMAFHVPYRNKIALNRPHSAWISDNHKLLYFHDDGEVRLFDLTHDCGETQNLATALPLRAEAMEKSLLSYLDEVNAPRWQEGITWKGNPFSTYQSTH